MCMYVIPHVQRSLIINCNMCTDIRIHTHNKNKTLSSYVKVYCYNHNYVKWMIILQFLPTAFFRIIPDLLCPLNIRSLQNDLTLLIFRCASEDIPSITFFCFSNRALSRYSHFVLSAIMISYVLHLSHKVSISLFTSPLPMAIS